eukprot:4196140-Prymnesium_polylepis.2
MGDLLLRRLLFRMMIDSPRTGPAHATDIGSAFSLYGFRNYCGLGPTGNLLRDGRSSGEVPESGFTAPGPRLVVRRSAEFGSWRAHARQEHILTSSRRHLKPHMHGRSSHSNGPMTLQVRIRQHHGFTMRA